LPPRAPAKGAAVRRRRFRPSIAPRAPAKD